MTNLEETVSIYENAIENINLPLSILHTYVTLLDSLELEPSAKEYLKAAQDSCLTILDLLPKQKNIEPNIMDIDKQNIYQLLKNNVDSAKLLAARKNITLSFSGNFDDFFIDTDSFVFSKALLQLLSYTIHLSNPYTTIYVELQVSDRDVFVFIENPKSFDPAIFNTKSQELLDIKRLFSPIGWSITHERVDGFTLELPSSEGSKVISMGNSLDRLQLTLF